MPKLKAIVKRPDEKYGHMTNISASLENLQKTVGGYVESVTCEDFVILCNEDGKNLGLAMNMPLGGDVLLGTIIVIGTDGEEFADLAISFDEWKQFVGEQYENMVNLLFERKGQK